MVYCFYKIKTLQRFLSAKLSCQVLHMLYLHSTIIRGHDARPTKLKPHTSTSFVSININGTSLRI